LSVDPGILLAIVAMGIATYFTRVAWIFIGGRLALTGRAKAAFDAIPPAVLVAVIAPTVLATGVPETLAALITALVASRLPLLATILVGVLSVVALRAIL
jgi:uncharacterized membrane protein